MGCHTWVAKKLQAFTQEEKQTQIKESLHDFKTMYPYKSAEDYCKSMGDFYKEEVEKYDSYLAAGRYDNLDEKEKQKITKLIDKWRVLANDPSTLEKEYNKRMKEKQKGITILERGDEEAFQFAISKLKYPDLVKYNGEKYIHISFDDPFRVSSSYSEKRITSEIELLEYIKNGGEIVVYYDDKTNKFIEGYTDALVERIHAFFEKHGKDNLLFHFG